MCYVSACLRPTKVSNNIQITKLATRGTQGVTIMCYVSACLQPAKVSNNIQITKLATRGTRGGVRLPQFQQEQKQYKLSNNSIQVVCSNRRRQFVKNNSGQSGVNNNNLIQLTGPYELPSIINTNAQSLVPKIDELQTRVNSSPVTAVCVTESWLKSTVPDDVIGLDGYGIPVRKDRTSNTTGGGVCCYIQRGIPFKVWRELEDPDLDTIWVTLHPQHLPRQISHVTIGLIYMPPGCPKRPRNEKSMIDHIIKALDFITVKHPSTGIIITGDFNRMKDATLKRFPLKQIVWEPTHGDAILDCIYTNLAEYYSTPSVQPGLGLSRHGVVQCTPLIVNPVSLHHSRGEGRQETDVDQDH